MKKQLCILLVFAFVLSFGVGQVSAKEIRFGHVAPDWSGDVHGAIEMAKYVKEKTNGAYDIKVFPNSQLGGMMSLLQQVQLGVLEMAVAVSAVLMNTVPEVGVFDLPFVWPSKEVCYAVMADREFQDKLSSYLAKKNLVMCGYIQNGWRAITNSKRPVTTPADMKGLKLRTMQSPMHLDAFKLLGTTPVAMAYGEVYQGLQQGVIDGQDNAVEVSVMMKFTEVNKYATETGHTYTCGPAIVNLDFWNSLSAAEQKIFQDGAALSWEVNKKVHEGIMNDIPGSGGKSYEQIFKESGGQLIKLTDKERAVFADTMRPIWAKYRSSIGPEFYDFFMKKIEQYNK